MLLYDALHDMEDKQAVLREIHRVLKSQGTLSYKDHTLKGEALLSLMRGDITESCGWTGNRKSVSFGETNYHVGIADWRTRSWTKVSHLG